MQVYLPTAKSDEVSLLVQILLSICTTYCGGTFVTQTWHKTNTLADIRNKEEAQQPLRLLGIDSVPPRGLEPRTR